MFNMEVGCGPLQKDPPILLNRGLCIRGQHSAGEPSVFNHNWFGLFLGHPLTPSMSLETFGFPKKQPDKGLAHPTESQASVILKIALVLVGAAQKEPPSPIILKLTPTHKSDTCQRHPPKKQKNTLRTRTKLHNVRTHLILVVFFVFPDSLEVSFHHISALAAFK